MISKSHDDIPKITVGDEDSYAYPPLINENSSISLADNMSHFNTGSAHSLASGISIPYIGSNLQLPLKIIIEYDILAGQYYLYLMLADILRQKFPDQKSFKVVSFFACIVNSMICNLLYMIQIGYPTHTDGNFTVKLQRKLLHDSKGKYMKI